MRMRLIDAESLKELFPDNGEGSWTYNATAKAYIDAQPEQQNARIFQGVIVEYPTNSTYPEHERKPYFLIKYTEDGQDFIGYGTYKPDVLSEYLKKYFMPSAQPDTTTHDSIPAKTGGNDGDGTSGDCISRQAAIDALLGITAMRNTIPLDSAIFNIKKLPSAQPEIIRCKDCIYQTESWIGIKYCEAHGDHIGKDYDYCSNARRKENGQTDFTASGD